VSKADGRVTLREIFAVMRDPALKPEEKVLWALYRSYERPERGAYCGKETLAEHMAVSTRSVERHRASLLRDEKKQPRGYLKVTFRGPFPAEYRALVPEKAPTAMSEQAPTQGSEQPQSTDSPVGASTDRSTDSGVGQVRGVRELPSLSCLPRRNGARCYPTEFERVWEKYPKREGGNSKPNAYSAWRARVNEGEPPAELEAGTERYATYCEATGIVGTRFVKQASTFFGPGEHYRQDLAVSGDAPQPALANLQALQ
jgi:hypothetical protein